MNVDEYPDESDRSFAAVDRLVRDHLGRSAESIDTTAMVEHLRSSSRPTFPVSTASAASRSGFPSRFAWLVPALACLAAAFLLGRWIAPSTVEAATVLKAVQAAQRPDLDRLYRMSFHPDPSYWDGKNVLRGPSETLLWTRGDRFWADTRFGSARLIYGRDDEGTIWLSPSRSSGVRFSAEDAPDEIDLYCAINSMTVSRLLEDVLADFELKNSALPEGSEGARSTGRTAILATLKPGRSHPFVSSALLEVDETDTLVRLILWTLDDGQPRGTVTYTLAETARLDDAVYRLSYHVDDDAKVSEQRFPRSDKAPAKPATESKSDSTASEE